VKLGTSNFRVERVYACYITPKTDVFIVMWPL